MADHREIEDSLENLDNEDEVYDDDEPDDDDKEPAEIDASEEGLERLRGLSLWVMTGDLSEVTRYHSKQSINILVCMAY